MDTDSALAPSATPESDRPRRRRWRRDQRQALVEAWRSSGLTIRAFAAEHRLAPSTIGKWIRASEHESALATRTSSAQHRGPGFVVALPPAGDDATMEAAEASEGSPALHWDLPGELGTVRGAAPALAPLLWAALGGRGQ